MMLRMDICVSSFQGGEGVLEEDFRGRERERGEGGGRKMAG
jgi:hypothetical protein